MLNHLLIGFGCDVLALLVLIGWLYRRRPTAPEMTMVFATLNVGLFAAVAAIGSGEFPVGVGFGLFGLLSLVRLRSTAFSVRDVSYTFIALVLALINALAGHNWWLAPGLTAVVLATIWVVDEKREDGEAQTMRMTLDRAHTSLADVRERVTELLGHAPTGVQIVSVDMVRETTVVVVRHDVPDGGVPVQPRDRDDDDD